MSLPGIILDYHGPIDYRILDSLLMELKNTREFADLHTTIRKRAYSLIVECIENICKHSAIKKSDDDRLQPHVLVKNEDKRILIEVGNPVAEEKRESIRRKLDTVNNMTVGELRELHEVRLNHNTVIEENGAGLGFICIAFKSGNRLLYNFNPLISGFVYFEMQVCLNK